MDTVCDPWCSLDDVTGCGPYAALSESDVEPWLVPVSNWLYRASGRQWPGVCTVTIRPEAGPCAPRHRRDHPTSAAWEVWLDPAPVLEVLSVTVDGVVLASSEYRVDEGRWLVRLGSTVGTVGWPSVQRLDLPATAPDTWAVAYRWGGPPPDDGITAAAHLAGEFALACTGADCRLPTRVTSITRQGVSMTILDPFDFLERGQTGILEVDQFVTSVNPARQEHRPRVLSPDWPPRHRRIG